MRGGQVLLMAVTLLALPAGAVGREAARYGQVILPGGTVLDVELAESPARRQRGYMFRDGVGPEDGMIFLFEEEEFHSFWMKNVSFPLDILWMAGDGTVVDVSLLLAPTGLRKELVELRKQVRNSRFGGEEAFAFGMILQVLNHIESASLSASLSAAPRLHLELAAPSADAAETLNDLVRSWRAMFQILLPVGRFSHYMRTGALVVVGPVYAVLRRIYSHNRKYSDLKQYWKF